MTIEEKKLEFVRGSEDVTASFEVGTNVPARLQVWLHNEDGTVNSIDCRMFLRTLEVKRDAIPVSFDGMMTSYVPGAREVEALLHDGGVGWTWRFRTIDGRRVAVPERTR